MVAAGRGAQGQMYVCAPSDKGDLVGLPEEPARQPSREIPGLWEGNSET